MARTIPLTSRRTHLLARIFREELAKTKLTQTEAGELLGVSQATVAMILRGRRLPSLALYERMVENFPGTIRWLTDP